MALNDLSAKIARGEIVPREATPRRWNPSKWSPGQEMCVIPPWGGQESLRIARWDIDDWDDPYAVWGP